MRLLDLVAHGPALRPADSRESHLPIPSDFAQDVLTCPLRLVLNDDLVRCSTELGFADGDRVAGCSDLIRVPSERLWVEWNEVPRKACLEQIAHLPPTGGAPARRAGALIRAHADGRSGEVRTFWSTPDDRVYCAALVAEFDLDTEIRAAEAAELSIFDGGYGGVALLNEPAIDALLAHIRFRFERPWLDYYRAVRLPQSDQAMVLRTALGTSAFDLPMLFALFLLMSAKDGARRRPVNLERLNRSRRAAGKFPLLEHIEVNSCITGQRSAAGRSPLGDSHSSRRLHHVRGHLARRGHTIYWRSPHLRGSARLGVIKTRTVELAFN
jgi:hypothetical protein